MPHSALLNVTDSLDCAVVARSTTTEITVMEDGSSVGFPRCDFLVKKAAPGSEYMRKPTGAPYSFRGMGTFSPGQVVGYVRLPAGTNAAVFSQDEL